MAERDMPPNHTTRVLVADGDKESRAAIIWCLLSEGYRVDPVSDGFAAAAAMEHPPFPTVAVIDLGLQGFNGRRLIEHMRLSPRLRQIPILATGFVEPFAPLPRGVTFLKKPCNGELLLARIRQMGSEALTSFFPSKSFHGDRRTPPLGAPTFSHPAHAAHDDVTEANTQRTRTAHNK